MITDRSINSFLILGILPNPLNISSMGHRTYLIKSNPKASAVLFEANNLLPLFWLTLMEEDDVKRAEPAMRKRYAAIEETDEDNFVAGESHISVTKEDALVNAESNILFFEHSFPEVMPLYRDFITFLDKNTTEQDMLELDIFALSGFNNIDTLLQHLYEDLDALMLEDDEKISGYFNHADITTLIGYGDFPGENADKYKLPAVNRPQARPVAVPLAQLPDKKKLLMKGALSILVGIASLYLPYKGYLKEGISFTVVFCLVLSLLFLFWGYRELQSALRK